jgi:hypothetical protein
MMAMDRVHASLDAMLDRLERELEETEQQLGDKLGVLDKDRDGVIPVEELEIAIKNLLSNAKTDEAAAAVARRLDADGDGSVSIDDIIHYAEWRARTEKELLGDAMYDDSEDHADEQDDDEDNDKALNCASSSATSSHPTLSSSSTAASSHASAGNAATAPGGGPSTSTGPRSAFSAASDASYKRKSLLGAVGDALSNAAQTSGASAHAISSGASSETVQSPASALGRGKRADASSSEDEDLGTGTDHTAETDEEAEEDATVVLEALKKRKSGVSDDACDSAQPASSNRS